MSTHLLLVYFLALLRYLVADQLTNVLDDHGVFLKVTVSEQSQPLGKAKCHSYIAQYVTNIDSIQALSDIY